MAEKINNLEADLEAMRRALTFAAQILRDELGPGGFMQAEPQSARETWGEAASFLEGASDYPLIPLYMWRHPKPEG